MLNLQSLATDLYRWTTFPLRQAYLKRAIKTGTVPIGILFYHRVSDEFTNDWTMSRKQFQKQIEWMRTQFEFLSLQEAQERITAGFNDRPAICITFDDGYADNCNWAIPLLLQQNIPITYFVTTYHTTRDQPFPHDVQAGQPLRANSIESLKMLAQAGVEIGSHTRHHVDLGKIDDEATLFDEVITATRELESLIGREIKYFAFPYGQPENLNQRVVELARRHGFQGLCSTCKGWNKVGGDAFHLQRFHGDPSLSRMKNWLTFDPRDMHQEKYSIEIESAAAENSSLPQHRACPAIETHTTLDAPSHRLP